MRISFALSLMIFVALPAAAARPTLCEKILYSHSVDEIVSDADELMATAKFPTILADETTPEMGTFEPVILRPADKSQIHELRTARDYAVYTHAALGAKFVYVGTYENASVPVFDGLVTDKTGEPSFNVSLKYASIKMPEMKREVLLDSLKGRLNHDAEFSKTRSFLKWSTAMNGWRVPGVPDKPYFLPKYERDMTRAATLWRAFGLDSSSRYPFGRELMTVVDMRDSGYTFDFVNQPDFKREIDDMVRKWGYGNLTLTLLWNSSQVLEFGR